MDRMYRLHPEHRIPSEYPVQSGLEHLIFVASPIVSPCYGLLDIILTCSHSFIIKENAVSYERSKNQRPGAFKQELDFILGGSYDVIRVYLFSIVLTLSFIHRIMSASSSTSSELKTPSTTPSSHEEPVFDPTNIKIVWTHSPDDHSYVLLVTYDYVLSDAEVLRQREALRMRVCLRENRLIPLSSFSVQKVIKNAVTYQKFPHQLHDFEMVNSLLVVNMRELHTKALHVFAAIYNDLKTTILALNPDLNYELFCNPGDPRNATLKTHDAYLVAYRVMKYIQDNSVVMTITASGPVEYNVITSAKPTAERLALCAALGVKVDFCGSNVEGESVQ